MKKLFLSIMTASMFFVSCSNDETVVPENNGSENNVEDLVEIKLGAGSRIGSSVTESRAVTAVEEWADSMKVGVFALDNVGEWNDSDVQDALRNVLWSNVKGTIKVDATNNLFAEIIPASDAEKYYPRNDTTKNYTFYGYYPYTDNQFVTYADNNAGVTVTNSFTGNEDIMWGMTAKLEKGWNAKYARTQEEINENNKPNITFNHLLSWLNVNVVAGVDYHEQKEQCTIEELYVKHETSYTLTVANKTYGTEDVTAPTLAWTGDATELYIYNDEAGFALADNTYEGKVNDIFIKPSNELSFFLKFKEEDSINEIKLKLGENTTSIEAGKKYNVNIKISGPKAIEITATLTPWDTNTEDITGEI